RRCAPTAKDFTNQRYRYKDRIDEQVRAKDRTKSRTRAKVERAFHVMKRIFGFVKVSYRGLEKNANRLFVTCALANLYVVRGHLLARAQA
ncbi:MAG: transposase, partial [Rhodocyclaceae bacterium]|nr:transposase [Rhodocyclaceae bacterium]